VARKRVLADRGNLQLIYTTRYCFTGITGYVYLPGPGEPQYGRNAGTIIRGAADRKWHVATAAWDSLMSDAVATAEQQRTVDIILVSGGELKHPVEVTDPGLSRSSIHGLLRLRIGISRSREGV
jgi:hypothetical protein